MTDEMAASVTVRDHALWLAHISGDPQLASELSALTGGTIVELVVDGQPGTWRKLDDGADGRPTQALKPTSGEAKLHWHNLQEQRGTQVTISKSRESVPALSDHTGSVEAGEAAAPVAQQAAFIAKVDPVSTPQSGQILITAPVYGETPPSAGSKIYLWFSETKGGNGLARSGVILAAEDGSKPSFVIQLDGARVLKHLGKGDLAPHRDSQAATPIVGLARKLFKHSLNKVTALAADEEVYLAARMSVPPVATSAGLNPELAEFVALENRPGDGQRMMDDTARYRLTTSNEDPDVELEIKPGTLRGAAAEFIRAAGGTVVGRSLHLHMLKQRQIGKWDHGYVHSPSAKRRNWIRLADPT